MMPNNIKFFGAGSIVMGLLTAFIIGVTGWVGVQASQVPVIQAKFEQEISYLNENISELTQTAKETNKQLQRYSESSAENVNVITGSLVEYGYRIKQIEKECDETKRTLKMCEKHLIMTEIK